MVNSNAELTGDFARIMDAIAADYTGKIVRSNVWFLRREAPRGKRKTGNRSTRRSCGAPRRRNAPHNRMAMERSGIASPG